ncbi:MAG: sensor histidine kinase [Geobacteraceae bacterium]
MQQGKVAKMGVKSLRDVYFLRSEACGLLTTAVLFLLLVFIPVPVLAAGTATPLQKAHFWTEYKENVPVIAVIVVLQALLIVLLLLSRNSLRRTQFALKASEERLKEALETANRVFRYMETVRENERKHIAREIHDQLGQALTALKIELFRLKNSPREEKEAFTEAIDQMSDLVSETIRDVQRISSELRPQLLDDLGLVAAIEWLAQEFSERMGIPCYFDRQNAESCAGTACSTAIFRIVQESLTNICRHAQASQVEIILDCGSGRANLKIIDDGIGIRKDHLSSEESLGLLGIMERAHMCGGKADIFGEPGKGTTVVAIIPCSKDGVGTHEDTRS